jgi:hypothetical protein
VRRSASLGRQLGPVGDGQAGVFETPVEGDRGALIVLSKLKSAQSTEVLLDLFADIDRGPDAAWWPRSMPAAVTQLCAAWALTLDRSAIWRRLSPSVA